MNRVSIWYRKVRARLIEEFGGKCVECGAEDELEFAHVQETEVVGMGRGSWKRLQDVREHPEAYTLVCQPCHKELDGPFYRNRYVR